MDILTNSAALTAILALNRTQRALTATEDEASTGLAVSSASDNAAYWSMGRGSKRSDWGFADRIEFPQYERGYRQCYQYSADRRDR